MESITKTIISTILGLLLLYGVDAQAQRQQKRTISEDMFNALLSESPNTSRGARFVVTNRLRERYYIYVDLGLSVKWAICNVGATNPEDYGDYFAWGETRTKQASDFTWEKLKYCSYIQRGLDGEFQRYTKYCPYSQSKHWGGAGRPDNKTCLDLSDDAARQNWGDGWRTPTVEEWRELVNRCTWTWVTKGSKGGYKVTGPSGKSIFLPDTNGKDGMFSYDNGTGYGNYWASSLHSDMPWCAWRLYINSENFKVTHSSRAYGFTIRPVIP